MYFMLYVRTSTCSPVLVEQKMQRESLHGASVPFLFARVCHRAIYVESSPVRTYAHTHCTLHNMYLGLAYIHHGRRAAAQSIDLQQR